VKVVNQIPPLLFAQLGFKGWHRFLAFSDFPKKRSVALAAESGHVTGAFAKILGRWSVAFARTSVAGGAPSRINSIASANGSRVGGDRVLFCGRVPRSGPPF